MGPTQGTGESVYCICQHINFKLGCLCTSTPPPPTHTHSTPLTPPPPPHTHICTILSFPIYAAKAHQHSCLLPVLLHDNPLTLSPYIMTQQSFDPLPIYHDTQQSFDPLPVYHDTPILWPFTRISWHNNPFTLYPYIMTQQSFDPLPIYHDTTILLQQPPPSLNYLNWYTFTKLRFLQLVACKLSWPEPYVYTGYDRIFGNFPAINSV